MPLGDTEEVSGLLVCLIVIQWIIYQIGLPIFFVTFFYFPGWFLGLSATLYYAYFLVEIGFLKLFFKFRNPRLVD